MTNTQDLMARLRPLAEAVKCWEYKTVKQKSDDDTCKIGHTNEDGVFYDLIELDCENYDTPSKPLAAYIAATNPETIITLLDALEAAQAEVAAKEEAIRILLARNKWLEACTAGASPQPVEGLPPCWYIEHASYGQVTLRQDEADRAIQNGAVRVTAYSASSVQPSQAEELSDDDLQRLWVLATAPYLTGGRYYIPFARAIIAAINSKESK